MHLYVEWTIRYRIVLDKQTADLLELADFLLAEMEKEFEIRMCRTCKVYHRRKNVYWNGFGWVHYDSGYD